MERQKAFCTLVVLDLFFSLAVSFRRLGIFCFSNRFSGGVNFSAQFTHKPHPPTASKEGNINVPSRIAFAPVYFDQRLT